MTGGIERGFYIPGQSAREGIFTAKLVERVITFFCSAGILRDNDVARLMRACLLDVHFYPTRLFRTIPYSVFPTQVFGGEVIGVRAAVIDHGDGIKHIVGCEP